MPDRFEGYNPEQAEAAPSPEKRILLAQAGPAPRRAASQKSTDILTSKEVKKKLESLPGMTEEKIRNAERAIKAGLFSLLKHHAQLTKYFGIKGFNNSNYYMSLAVKESSLKPESESESSAHGYFQIKKEAFDDAKAHFPGVINFGYKDIQFDPNSSANAKLDKRKKQVLGRMASEKNAIVGILFFHLTKDKYLGSITRMPTMETGDAEKFTCFGYKIGSGATKTLYEMTGKPKTFREFAIKVAEKLKKESGGILTTPRNKSLDVLDETYNLGYRAYLEQNYTVPLKEKISGKTFSYGGRTFGVQNLVESLRYAEVVKSLMFKAPRPTGKLKDLPAPPKPQPKPKPKPKPKTPTKKPSGSASKEELEIIAASNGSDTIRDGNWMWGVADTFLEKCINQYRLDSCINTSITKTRRINAIIKTLNRYNKNVLGREEFAEIDVNDVEPELPKGTMVAFPPQDYAERHLKMYLPKKTKKEPKRTTQRPKTKEKAKKKYKLDVLDMKVEKLSTKDKRERLPRGVPLYVGAGKKITREGSELFEKPKKAPTVYHGKKFGTNKNLDLGVDINHGEMDPDDVRYIVLHSTAGSTDVLYMTASQIGEDDAQKMHFVVRKNGDIHMVRHTGMAINHAGLYKYKKGAMWNGDKQVSLHSIGIEVETEGIEKYNSAQYKALKEFLAYLGYKFNIPKSNVLGHFQVAEKRFYSKTFKKIVYQRGRKPDPRDLEWRKLGLQNNYRRVDPDVATGSLRSNLKRTKLEISGKIKTGWTGNTSEKMLIGIEEAEKIHQRKKAKKKKR